MATMNGKPVAEITKLEALEFCWANKDDYIREYASIDVGTQAFDSLIELIESGSIDIETLPGYGMSDQDIQA